MKISSIKVGTLSIPLIRPFITAVRSTEQVKDVVVMLHTDSGYIGYGSAASTPAITGDSEDSIIKALLHQIGPQLLGKDIRDLNHLLHLIDTSTSKNSSPKAAVDIALHDLFAQYCQLPLYRWLGGLTNNISTGITISVKAINEMVEDSMAMVIDGFKTLKIKVGLNVEEDIARVTAIRKSIGNKIRLVVDANQGWTGVDALKAINEFERQKLNIEWIEQPVAADDIAGLKYIHDHVKSPVIADEACFSPKDALMLSRLEACAAINIKLMKSGGLENAKSIYTIAKAAGMKLMVGCMLESPIGIAAMASFAVSKPEIILVDLDAICLIRTNPILGGMTLQKNVLTLNDKPGLGIEGIDHGFNLVGELST